MTCNLVWDNVMQMLEPSASCDYIAFSIQHGLLILLFSALAVCTVFCLRQIETVQDMLVTL